jgi:CRISPR-associated protein Csb1
VFGVWDSRGTQAKVPRAFRSVIRAYNVRKLSRSAQFNRATKFVEEGIIKEELDVGDGEKNPLSREGLKDSPATATHGGVIASGEIQRETTINLSAIRRLGAGETKDHQDDDSESNLKLRRYILGLALVAATATFDEMFDLREGCQLRQKSGHQPTWRVVPYRGEDQPLPELTDTAALQFAREAANAFGVGASDEYPFDKATAEKWLALKKEEQEKRRRTGPMTRQFQDNSDQAAAETTERATAQPRQGRRSRSGGEGR